MGKNIDLSNNMEDYLEAISVLDERKKYVRVKDIAKYMKVKMPSVTGALKSLAKKNLVNHEKYEYVELTQQGAIIAQEIRRRHDATLRFLTEILSMDPALAEEDACRIEHAISKTALDRLLKLIECMEECPRGLPECLKRFEYYVENGEKLATECSLGPTDDEAEEEAATSLDMLEPGAKAKIIKLSGRGAIRRRIMDMGIVPGANVELERVAPLGDPIELKIKDYHLSLRKDEAAKILVEVI